MPGIWISPKSKTLGFYVRFSTNTDWDQGTWAGGALSLNTPYHLVIDVAQSLWSIQVNGALAFGSEKDNHALSRQIPCYASNPWYKAADVEISRVLVTESESSDCAPGFFPQSGDIPGRGMVEGRGNNEHVSSCSSCGSICASLDGMFYLRIS